MELKVRYYKAFYIRRRDPYAYDNFLREAMTERDESKDKVFEHSLRYYEVMFIGKANGNGSQVSPLLTPIGMIHSRICT